MPAPIPATLARSLYEIESAIQPSGLGYVIDARRAPNGALRQAIEYREMNLARALVPAGKEAAAAHTGVLMACLATVDKPDDVSALIVKGFIDTLSECTAGPLAAAVDMFRTGKEGDGKWCPQAGEVARLANKLATPLHAELGTLRKVLNAKPVTREDNPDRKKAALAHAAETQRILAMARPANEVGKYRAQTKADEPPKPDVRGLEVGVAAMQAHADAEVERVRNLGPAPKLSPDVLARMGTRPKPPASGEEAA